MQNQGLVKLLLVDDEEEILNVIEELFQDEYQVFKATNAQNALLVAQNEAPALAIVDIMMPGMNGIELCQKFRENPITQNMPVIMLSAAAHTENKVNAFNLGADDFVAKPFDYEELKARVRSKLNRFSRTLHQGSKNLSLNGLVLDERTFSASLNGEAIPLSTVEYDLLALLLKNADQVISRKEIIKKVWKDQASDERVIDAHMVSLRKKLTPFKGGIRTIYGRGYVLESTKKSPATVE